MDRLINRFMLMVAIMFSLWIVVVSLMIGDLRAFRKDMDKFTKEQVEYNSSVSRVISKLAATTKHNYDFSRTNKAIIQNVAELYVPDEVALLRRIPAKP